MDINADLGEGGGNDERIMPLITSCNIACGGHYGDEDSIRKSVRLAKKNRLKIGAHWSFPDRKNFGRKVLDLSPEKLTAVLSEQLRLFRKVCEQEEVNLHHIKAHGALYNQGSNDPNCVEAMIRLLKELPASTYVFLQENNLLHQKVKGILPIKREAFIDRRYADTYTLLNREHTAALITEPEAAWR